MGGKGVSFDPALGKWMLRLAGFGLLGGFGGVLYFHAVRRSALALARGAGLAGTMIFIAGRFILLGALLVFASRGGAGTLLATAAGILAGRTVMMRHLTRDAP